MTSFCTCTKLDCAMHPTRHDKGCTPCIAANLKTRDLPVCFFHLLGNADQRKDTSLAEFARLAALAEGDAAP